MEDFISKFYIHSVDPDLIFLWMRHNGYDNDDILLTCFDILSQDELVGEILYLLQLRQDPILNDVKILISTIRSH